MCVIPFSSRMPIHTRFRNNSTLWFPAVWKMHRFFQPRNRSFEFGYRHQQLCRPSVMHCTQPHRTIAEVADRWEILRAKPKQLWTELDGLWNGNFLVFSSSNIWKWKIQNVCSKFNVMQVVALVIMRRNFIQDSTGNMNRMLLPEF